MKNNDQILRERTAQYNSIKGARVGDFLWLPTGQYVIFSQNLGDSLQTSSGGSLYLGNGYISFSGGLNRGVSKSDIESTKKTKTGSIWFFDEGISGAGRGIKFDFQFRVFKLKPNADTSGIPQIKEFKEKQIRERAEKITRINGNGKEYTLPIPEIVINTDNLTDLYLNHIFTQTGLRFEKYGWGYKAQPMTSNQIIKLLSMDKFESTFYNNASFNNILFLKFKKK